MHENFARLISAGCLRTCVRASCSEIIQIKFWDDDSADLTDYQITVFQDRT